MNIAIARNTRNGLAVGKYIPPIIMSNEEVATLFSKNNVKTNHQEPITAKDIENLIGIRQRHLTPAYMNLSDLAYHAGSAALCNSGICWDSIDVCAIGSSSHQNNFPATACSTLNRALYSLPSDTLIDAEAVDISLACTSGIATMIYVARALITEEEYEYGLAIGAEVIASRMATFKQQNDDLWGDGAGAVVLERTDEDRGIICSILKSDPKLEKLTRSIGYGTYSEEDLTTEQRALGPHIMLKGHEVHKYVVGHIDIWVKELLEKANRSQVKCKKPEIKLNDLDLIITHQANGQIYDRPAKKLGVPVSLFYNNIADYGNTSSASILIALAEAIEKGVIGPGTLIALVGFGGGMTYGTILLKL